MSLSSLNVCFYAAITFLMFTVHSCLLGTFRCYKSFVTFNWIKLNKTDEVCNKIFSRASYFLETETTVHFKFQLKLLSKFLFCLVLNIFWKKKKSHFKIIKMINLDLFTNCVLPLCLFLFYTIVTEVN